MLAAGAAVGAIAGPEDPDPTFGESGVVLLAGQETETAMVVVLADGRMLVVVQAAPGAEGQPEVRESPGVRRLLGDGRPDPSFGGGDGAVTVQEVCGNDCRLIAIVSANDGIYVVTADGVYRLTVDGDVDRSFGTNARGAAPLAVPDAAPLSLVDQGSAGLIVVANPDRNYAVGSEVAVYRLRRDGSLDVSFGQQGIAHVTFPDDAYRAAAIDPLGRPLLASASRILRLLRDGAVDPSFGARGPWSSHVDKSIDIETLLHDGGGRIIAVGRESKHSASYPEIQAVVLALRNSDGQLDESFADAGIARLLTDRPGEDAIAYALAIDASGRIVVAGNAGHFSYLPFEFVVRRVLVSRLLASGMPDHDFAPGGSTAFWTGRSSESRSVALRPGGGIVIAGTAHDPPTYRPKYVDYNARAALFGLNGGDADRKRVAIEANAIEFYHAEFGHYFVTADAGEAFRLDNNAAWSRTGRTFAVWPYAADDTLPVCRFFSDQRFSPRSSHFYTPIATECTLLRQQAFWTFEGEVFHVARPAAGSDGRLACPAGTEALYRMYNNGAGGAPNHRYTVDVAVLDAMVSQGWTMEGDALTRIFTCVPLQE